ncbi:hypothetical protein A2482_01180 [Candidatus Falkowbacteria bacterium RIFOXYC2_FULL_48_21]|uniref:Uncharacterized protein n=1 Tax=Candidatus Falkowbacteria bacterium RIFOXYC2_FULL_48_21 TaxID=1798005 RepID=A0A1F5T5V3_9BACT|nr:MAG: hypothetical protein A2482_01180 [Candidatus Falkowbacteria bacterium RIFOXYC2_FULL_48_21]
MIGLLIAITLLLREGDGWRQAVLRLLVVTTAWLPMLIVVWFLYMISSAITEYDINKKEEVQS